MNRQIRRLGVALIVLFVALFVQLNYVQVVRADELQRQPEQHPGRHPRLQPAPRRTSRPPTASVLARSVPVDGPFERQRQYPERRAVRPRHRLLLLHLRHRRRRAHLQRRAGRAGRGDVDREPRRPPRSTRTAPPTCASRSSAEVQQVATRGARRPAGLGRRPRPARRRHPRPLELPDLRPEPAVVRSTRTPAAGRPEPAAGATEGNPLLPAAYRERYFPGSTFKVVTAVGRPRPRAATPDQPSLPARRASSCRPRPPGRSATSAAGPAAATSSTSCGCRATPASPRSASTSAAPALVGHGRGLRLQPAGRRSTCPTPAAVDHRATSSSSTRTSRCWPRPPSARTRSRPPRCRWRSWPPASPTAAWS